MKPLSKRQQEVLEFCGEFFARNDQLPSRRAICDQFGWASWNSAEEIMRGLERKGYIERNELNKFRFTPGGRTNITLAGKLARWFPTNGTAEPTNGSVVLSSAG